MNAAVVYKILTASEWQVLQEQGRFAGSAADLRDGFIHLSAEDQVAGTAARHFSGQRGLMLLAVAVDRLPSGTLRWEQSRGGALFPHLFAPLDLTTVVAADPYPPDEEDPGCA